MTENNIPPSFPERSNMSLPGWEKSELAKDPTYTKSFEGKVYGFVCVGSARRFFQMNEFRKRDYLETLPIWIEREINPEKLAGQSATEDTAYMGIAPYFPEIVSFELFKKFQTMTVEERLCFFQKTDERQIKELKRKSGTYKYIDIGYIISVLNICFGYAWSSHIEKIETTNSEIICQGYIKVQIYNRDIIKTGIGQSDRIFFQGTKEDVNIGDRYKSAESDMLKKCASQFGIAKDVYSPIEEFCGG